MNRVLKINNKVTGDIFHAHWYEHSIVKILVSPNWIYRFNTIQLTFQLDNDKLHLKFTQRNDVEKNVRKLTLTSNFEIQ
jgi:hypothetical protein